MMNWLFTILDGLKVYVILFPVVTLVLLVKNFITKNHNKVAFILDHMLVAYIICMLALVFFPLPSAEAAMELDGYTGRFYPGSFIFDIARDKSVTSVLQIVFNVVMTVPFGAYLTYRTGFERKDVVILSFLLSLYIEVGQLTGLFFIFNGSYRLFDVDDLICNTLGGLIGYILVSKAYKKYSLPVIAAFDDYKASEKKAKIA